MKIIDKIKNHAHENDSAAEKASQEQATKAVAAPAPAAEKKHKEGPKMHPDLLELYTVTDNVLGVGTFATVKEIVLKSSGKTCQQNDTKMAAGDLFSILRAVPFPWPLPFSPLALLSKHMYLLGE